MKYSVVLCTLCGIGHDRVAAADVWENPRGVLETIAAAGYDGVDVDAEPDRIAPQSFERVAGIATSLGLQTPALIAAWGRGHAGEARDLASTDEAARTYAVSYARKCVDLSAGMGGPVIEICAVPGAAEEYPNCSIPLDIARRNFMRSAAEIAEYAERKGVPVAIEAINRFEGYPGLLNSIADAMTVVEAIDSPNLGVLGDCFHINIEDTSVNDALTRAGDRLLHIHLADSNRAAPGSGHIDFLQLLRTLHAIDYQGYMAVDCVPHVPDWKTSLVQSIDTMKQLERAIALLHQTTSAPGEMP